MPVHSTIMYTSDGGSSRPTKTDLAYDPTTGTWVPSTPSSSGSTTTTPKKSTTPPKNSSSSTGSSQKSNVDTQKKADKEYIEAEFNVLTGEMTVTPTEKSIRIKVNDTVRIEGLGKYLSGLYFVSAVKRTLTASDGYTHTFSLRKNGFGDSVKSASSYESQTRKEEVSKQASDLKVGDSVKIVGDNAVYSNAHDGVKVPKWVKKKTLTVDAISSDGTRVRLMPIFSWTYIKYVQKV